MPVFVLYCCETTTTVETVYSSQFTEGLARLASIIEKQRQQGGDMAAKAEGSHLRQQTGSRESRLQQCKSLNSQNSGLGLERWLSSSEYVLLLQRKFSSQHTHIRCLTTNCPSGTRKCNILFWPPQTTAVFTYSVKNIVSDTLPPTKPHLLPLLTEPATRTKLSNARDPWGQFSFKPVHLVIS